MTSPSPTSTRVLLISERPAGLGDEAGVRRYRLARLRFDARPRTGEERFEHLKRTYD